MDALFARIAERTAVLRDAGSTPETIAEERALLGDLAAVAANLRESTTAASAALARVLDAEPRNGAASDPASGVRREKQRLDPLTRVAVLRGTDKWGAHFYTPIYHELFQHLRDMPIRVLEIGVGGHESRLAGGASLLMWADYFPHARITGIDIAEKQLPPHARIIILQGRQEDRAFLERVVAEHGPFDIVIDDGSHVPAHVQASFEVLFPLLRDRGFYVVEDVQAAFWPRFGGSAPDGGETLGLARAALVALNHAEIAVADPEWTPPAMAPIIRSLRAYHNLLVFERGDNQQPSTGRFDGKSPDVAAALRAMDALLTSRPTPAGLAHLARTYSQARQTERAVATLERGLAQWPDDIDLLLAGAKVGRRAGNEALAARCHDGLARAAANDPSLQDVVRKARGTGQ